MTGMGFCQFSQLLTGTLVDISTRAGAQLHRLAEAPKPDKTAASQALVPKPSEW